MTNFDLSLQVFEFLKASGTTTVVVCAGARNAPLVTALQNQKFKIYSYFEERSAAFFALGLIRASGQPVAVLTTSGTATAELLPAAIEATYQGLPLILITADRPKSFRGSGSPQTIEQVGLFTQYVESTYDLDVYTKNFNFNWSITRPIHLNVCFDEPLFDKASNEKIKPSVLNKVNVVSAKPLGALQSSKPLIIVGSLNTSDVETVVEFILSAKAPVFAESISQLRGIKKLEPYLLCSSDQIVAQLFKEKECQSVIRIGGVPTLRFWRDLEGDFKTIPVMHFSNLKFSGLARPSQIFEMAVLKDLQIKDANFNFEKIRTADQNLQSKKVELFKKYPLSEPAFVSHLARQVGDRPIYLGNSLPIRHWDQFTDGVNKNIYANRGANGIDGQVSTYLGWSEKLSDSFCLVGDLTALYDLAALGLAPQLALNKRRIIIINNFGGQIFNRVLKNELFINSHKTQFKHWAALWNWPYQLVQTEKEFSTLANDNAVIELQPDAEQTKMFWSEWDLACQQKN